MIIRLHHVTTSIPEKAWLYDEHAIDICFDYIHSSNFCFHIRFFKTLRLPFKRSLMPHLSLPCGRVLDF